jgi:hypothetical protein
MQLIRSPVDYVWCDLNSYLEYDTPNDSHACLLYSEPFQCSELPELIEDYLEHKCARCCAFNRKGTLLAGEPTT